MELTIQILATITISIMTSQLFLNMTTFQVIDLRTEPKSFGSNDYLHIKNKELKEDKETKEDFNSKDISKKFIHRYIHSLSRYLSRGLRYEKNSSLELVGNAAATAEGQKAVQLDLATKAIEAKQNIAKESTVVLMDGQKSDASHVVAESMAVVAAMNASGSFSATPTSSSTSTPTSGNE